MTQLVARIPEELVLAIDRLVDSGEYKSRSEAVRRALQELISTSERRRLGLAIAEGYRRVPQDDDLRQWAERSGRAMIDAEPW